jgi:hypothetical protein
MLNQQFKPNVSPHSFLVWYGELLGAMFDSMIEQLIYQGRDDWDLGEEESNRLHFILSKVHQKCVADLKQTTSQMLALCGAHTNEMTSAYIYPAVWKACVMIKLLDMSMRQMVFTMEYVYIHRCMPKSVSIGEWPFKTQMEPTVTYPPDIESETEWKFGWSTLTRKQWLAFIKGLFSDSELRQSCIKWIQQVCE